MAKFSDAEIAVGASTLYKNIMTYKKMGDQARVAQKREESKQIYRKAEFELDKLKTLLSIRNTVQDQKHKKAQTDHLSKVFDLKAKNENSVENRQKHVRQLLNNSELSFSPQQIQNLHIWGLTDNDKIISDIFQDPEAKQPSANERSNLSAMQGDLQHIVGGGLDKKTGEYYKGQKPFATLVDLYSKDGQTSEEALLLANKVRNLQMLVSNLSKPENARWTGGSENMALDQLERSLRSINTPLGINPPHTRNKWPYLGIFKNPHITDTVAKQVGQVFGKTWGTIAEYEKGMTQEVTNLILMIKSAKGQGQAPQQGQQQQAQQPQQAEVPTEGQAAEAFNAAAGSMESANQKKGMLSGDRFSDQHPDEQPTAIRNLTAKQGFSPLFSGGEGLSDEWPSILIDFAGEEVTRKPHGFYSKIPAGDRGFFKNTVDTVASWNASGGTGIESRIKQNISVIEGLMGSLEEGKDTPENQEQVFVHMMNFLNDLGWPEPEDPDLRLSNDTKARLQALLKKFTQKDISPESENGNANLPNLLGDKPKEEHWFNKSINRGDNASSN